MIRVSAIIVPLGPRPGLSERFVRRLLVKRGCKVWRGSFLSSEWHSESVFFKYNYLRYEELCRRMAASCGVKAFRRIRAYCKNHHGEPDFIAWDGKKLFFVEAKLENEQIRRRQLTTMAFLSRYFEIKVYRAFFATRLGEAEIDVEGYLTAGGVNVKPHVLVRARSPIVGKR
ncbi:MAG: hypothetical protein V1735_06595 [Nanoarchaeota archaeon]